MPYSRQWNLVTILRIEDLLEELRALQLHLVVLEDVLHLVMEFMKACFFRSKKLPFNPVISQLVI